MERLRDSISNRKIAMYIGMASQTFQGKIVPQKELCDAIQVGYFLKNRGQKRGKEVESLKYWCLSCGLNYKVYDLLLHANVKSVEELLKNAKETSKNNYKLVLTYTKR